MNMVARVRSTAAAQLVVVVAEEDLIALLVVAIGDVVVASGAVLRVRTHSALLITMERITLVFCILRGITRRLVH
jgi:hypothetical protein